MLNGLLDLSVWGYVGVTLALTHVTIASVTIFLHRYQAHNALSMHPLVSHFFRFWLWLTTGMVTKEWVAVHRKHHAKCETAEDPHSPQITGIWSVLLGGVLLYRTAAQDHESIERYGKGTPDDWLERTLYARHRFLGIAFLAAIDVLLFGAVGVAIWLVQMLWIPLWAAGVINGLGHFWGYRNFETSDASRNLSPIGLLIGGEELHNNHHAYPQSARLSNKWWEFDIGWLYIRLLEIVGLARVRTVSPSTHVVDKKRAVDLDTLRAVVGNRYHILTLYGRKVIAPVVRGEKHTWAGAGSLLRQVRRLMTREDIALTAAARETLDAALARSAALETVYRFKMQLKALWARTGGDSVKRVERLNAWCVEAERSGIQALADFAHVLRGYALRTAKA